MKRGEILWRDEDTENELEYLYQHEGNPHLRSRWQALWLLRRGKSRVEVCDFVGANARTLRDWIGWYRQGGVEAVKGHRKGGYGKPPRLNQEQYDEIIDRAGKGEFARVDDVRLWVEMRWGVVYGYKGMYSVLQRLHIHSRVPRPLAAKADVEGQEAWKKGGSPKLCWHKG